MSFFFCLMKTICIFCKGNNVIENIQIDEHFTYLSVPYVDALPIAIISPGLPSGIEITASFFKGVKPYRDYNLLDEVLRQSDRLNKNKKIKWIIKWS